jgi:photosystem II stability/assembly factor-like uncharacterized protein
VITQKDPKLMRGPLVFAAVFVLGAAAYATLRFAAAAPAASPGGAAGVEGEILPDREDFYAVSVVDPDHAWIVGSYGTVLAISEQGRKVELRPAPVRQPLFCASFRDASTGLVGGRGGLVLRTTDGGRSWSHATVPGVSENILAMARGADPRRVWAVGPRGTVIRSADDGETWEDHSLGKDITLNAVTFVNDKEGWVVGEFGTILHTVDGGNAWQRSEAIDGLPPYVEDVTEEEALRMGIPPLRSDDLYLFAVVFPTPDTGYAVAAGGFVLETSDRGGHWTAKQAATRNTLFDITSVRGDLMLSTGVLGTIVHRREGRWMQNEEISHRIFTWLRSVRFSADGGFGVAVGGKATVLFSRDRGDSWEALSRERLAQLRKPSA